jgi:ribosome biogenesis SPOUT family RNA methylase Rps3
MSIKGVIEVIDYVEDDDGGATLTVDLDEEARKNLLEFALIELIKKGTGYED